MTSNTRWRKSSFSGGGANDCVEVDRHSEYVGIRDSKTPQASIAIGVDGFSRFLTAIKDNTLV